MGISFSRGSPFLVVGLCLLVEGSCLLVEESCLLRIYYFVSLNVLQVMKGEIFASSKFTLSYSSVLPI